MSKVPFNDLAAYGEIDEILNHATPMNAWTTAQNVTFRDGFVQKSNGYTEIAAGAAMLCAPQFLMPYYDPESRQAILDLSGHGGRQRQGCYLYVRRYHAYRSYQRRRLRWHGILRGYHALEWCGR